MKSLLSLPLALMTVALLTACGPASQAVSPEDLVPANINLIAQVQVAKLLQDEYFWSMYQQRSGGPSDLDELLDLAFPETSLDFRQFTSAVVFGDMAQDETYIGVIAQGQIDKGQILAFIEDFGKNFVGIKDYSLETTDYSGQQVYLEQEDLDDLALAFLDNDKVVLGTLPAVQDVIDVHQGRLERASGRVYSTFNDLGGPLFSMVVVIPPETRAELEDASEAGQGLGMMPAMQALGDLDLITVLMDRPGDDAKFEATLDFLNAQSAAQMGDIIDGSLKLAAGFYPDGGAQALMDKTRLSVDGTRVTLKFRAPISEIQEAARSLEPSFGGPY